MSTEPQAPSGVSESDPWQREDGGLMLAQAKIRDATLEAGVGTGREGLRLPLRGAIRVDCSEGSEGHGDLLACPTAREWVA